MQTNKRIDSSDQLIMHWINSDYISHQHTYIIISRDNQHIWEQNQKDKQVPITFRTVGFSIYAGKKDILSLSVKECLSVKDV